MNKDKIILFLIKAVFIALLFYLVYPKYEFYQSAGDGTVSYRFNKITGHLESSIDAGIWEKTYTNGFIKKP